MRKWKVAGSVLIHFIGDGYNSEFYGRLYFFIAA
jgi:hypothetical protein